MTAAIAVENGKPVIQADPNLTVVAIDKGRSDGIAEGDTLEIVEPRRGGALVGHAVVTMAHPKSAIVRVESPAGLVVSPSQRFVRRPRREESAPHSVLQAGHATEVTFLTFSDGDRLLVSGDRRQLSVWDLARGRRILTRAVPEIVQAYAAALDGPSLVSMTPGVFYAWDPRRWVIGDSRPRTVTRCHDPFGSLSVSDDGRTVAATCGSDEALVFRAGLHAPPLAIHPSETARREESFVPAAPIVLSGDGTRVATAHVELRLAATGLQSPRLYVLRDAASGRILTKFGKQAADPRVARFVPGRELFVHDDGGALTFWRFDGRLQQRLPVGDVGLKALAFAPDGSQLATVNETGTIELRTGTDYRTTVALGGGAAKGLGVFSVGLAFSRSGTLLAAALTGGGVGVWDTRSRQWVAELPGHGRDAVSASISPDSTRLAQVYRGGRTVVWDLRGGPARSFEVPGADRVLFAGSPDRLLLQRLRAGRHSDGEVELATLDVVTGSHTTVVSGIPSSLAAVAVSGDGGTAIVATDETVELWDVVAKQRITQQEVMSPQEHRRWFDRPGDRDRLPDLARRSVFVGLTPDESRLVYGRSDGIVRVWEFSHGRIGASQGVRRLSALDAMALSPDSRRAVVAEPGSGQLKILRLPDLREVMSVQNPGQVAELLRWSADGKHVALAGISRAHLWAVTTRQPLYTVSEASAPIDVSFLESGSLLAATTAAGEMILIDTATGSRLVTMTPARAGADANPTRPGHPSSASSRAEPHWVARTDDGRFDSHDLNTVQPFSWISPDDPLTPLPPEIFMRDYFEPRLLARRIGCALARPGVPSCDREFRPVRSLAAINRVQPEVAIRSVTPKWRLQGNVRVADAVTVVVEVRGVEQSFGGPPGTAGARTWQSGVYDLRLFRDGQLVGQTPDIATPERLEASDADAELSRWRGPRQLVEGVGAQTVTFRNVALPRGMKGQRVEFSAYAFNRDRVKSATARCSYTLPHGVARARTAYVIAVGVSAYSNPRWDLRYAHRDAQRFLDVLAPRLQRTGDYDAVVTHLLMSQRQVVEGRTVVSADATKANIRAVLDMLAGRRSPASPSRRGAMSGNGAGLRRAEPGDLVLILFSGHGATDRAGNFYLFPHDVGDGPVDSLGEPVLQRAISSAELALWLKDVDAGDLVMVIDACHSAASVETAEFKPGPMGSRGLGQLAYDKGMRILAATRANDLAWETRETQQGLLSYALLHEGLERNLADFAPRDGRTWLGEWLRYGVERVPGLHTEVTRSNVADAPRLTVLDPVSRNSRRFELAGRPVLRSIQQPALFDYRQAPDSTLDPR